MISSWRNGSSSTRSPASAAPTRASWTRPQQALQDLRARRDLDLDGDAGMVAPEAAERVRQQVDAGRSGRAEVDRPGLEPGEGAQLLFGRTESRQCLRSARSENAPGLRQPAAAAASLDEPLAGRGLEEAQVLARARLAD